MALVIENGSIVANANSFVTVAEIREFAEARGIVLPVDDGDVEPFAVEAWDFLITVEPRMTGTRVSAEQEGVYPRNCVKINCFDVANTVIPVTLKKAQMQLAVDRSRGVPLVTDDSAERDIKREKIGPLETEWFGPGNATTGGSLEIAWGYLRPLLRVGFGVRTVRA